MIYTLTLNPAVDYVMHIDELYPGEIMRSFCESVHFGGKGINVSLVLKELGIKSTAMGFVAGFTGDAIENAVKSDMIKTDFLRIENGISRINVKLRSDTETDINGLGPVITYDDIERLLEKLDAVTSGDYLVMSGSIPKGVPVDIYEKIMKKLYNRNIRFVVDAEGDLLLNTLKYKPFLIKPNDLELGRIFGEDIDNAQQAAGYALKMRTMGARNVLVSMGDKGAVLVDEYNEVHFSDAPSGKVVNTVGAGDSMVAGFIAGYVNYGDFRYALKLGIGAGSATAFSENLAKKEDIIELLNKKDILN